jgi:hypothetical protein
MEIVTDTSHNHAESQPDFFFVLEKNEKVWYVLEIKKYTTQIYTPVICV